MMELDNMPNTPTTLSIKGIVSKNAIENNTINIMRLCFEEKYKKLLEAVKEQVSENPHLTWHVMEFVIRVDLEKTYSKRDLSLLKSPSNP